jgi:hypothetical protein
VTLLHARTHARTPVVTEIATTTTINNNRASTTTTIIIIIIVTALTDRQHALRQLDVGVRDPHQRARHPCARTRARPPRAPRSFSVRTHARTDRLLRGPRDPMHHDQSQR